MVYSRFYLGNQKKIPTMIAILFVLFIGIFFIRLFTKSAIPSKAEKKIVRRIETANISPNQVTIYWQTDQKVIGWIIFGENPNRLNNLAYDERDLTTNKKKYLDHYIILRNLNANKTYFYKLISDNQIVSNNGNDTFSFKTTPSNITGFQNREPAYGKVIQANGEPLENATVLVHIENSFPLVTLTKATGEWLIPINNLYDKNTYQQMKPRDKEKVIIEVLYENRISQVIADLSKVSPLPQSIIIGSNFNFSVSDNVLSATSVGTSEQPKKTIDIIFPEENRLIPGYNPLIKGVALPNSEVFITVHSTTEISSKVRTDNKGFWELYLPAPLSPGDHVITMRTTDRNGNMVTIERKFIIAKNGEQVLGSATPESTLTPTSEPVDTPTPTTQLYSTPTITLIPTQGPPRSGSDISIPLVGATSFIIVGIGLMLVF